MRSPITEVHTSDEQGRPAGGTTMGRGFTIYWQNGPLMVDGVVYFGAHDHHVYALDASTGRLECRFRTGGVSTASPVAARPGGGAGWLRSGWR